MAELEVRPKNSWKALVSDVVLYSTKSTQLVLRPEFVKNEQVPEAGVHFSFVYQKKKPNDTWEDAPAFNKAHMKAGDEIRLDLSAAETEALYQRLTLLKKMFAISGVPWEDKQYIILEGREVGLSGAAFSTALKNVVSSGRAVDIFNTLAKLAPDELTKFSVLRVAFERERALQCFREMLAEDLPEAEWQKFFNLNSWIFGYGLSYKFIDPLGTEVQYRPKDFTGHSSERGDFLMATAAAVRFTVLVEIKKPSTALFGPKKHRNGAWLLNDELIGGVSQVQVNCHSWVEQARSEVNQELLHDMQVYTYEPKGILVIGKTAQCDNRDKRKTFELYRRSLHNPEVLTFDELYERAKYIVSAKSDMPAPLGVQAPDENIEEDDAIQF